MADRIPAGDNDFVSVSAFTTIINKFHDQARNAADIAVLLHGKVSVNYFTVLHSFVQSTFMSSYILCFTVSLFSYKSVLLWQVKGTLNFL